MSFALLLQLMLLLVSPVKTSDNTDRCPDNPDCVLVAHPLVGDLSVDGRLDEAAWAEAPVASGFKQFEPIEGAAPSQRTEVRILYGNSALYIGATLHDSQPTAIMQTLGRRDEFNKADWFMVAIDSYFDRKTAYLFAANAAGIQLDGIMTRDLDTSWDAVWEAAAQVSSTGWSVEMRIPYAMLRFPENSSQQWGINFRRYIPRLSEVNEWALITRQEMNAGPVSQYGTLQGLDNIRPRRNIQVTPYTLSQGTIERDEDTDVIHRDTHLGLGGDLKVGLTSSITLDVTVNPDFGQVESDPAELNLTAFETFFPERRPFFTEGTQIFSFELDRGGALLYTRRVGAENPILGATKISGRTGKGLSLGFFGAATGDDFSPNRYYGVARLQQQLGRYSSVGGIVTAYDQDDDEEMRRSFAGGLDWDIRLKDNAYAFDGRLSMTHRAAPGEADEQGFLLTTGFDKVRGAWNFFSGATITSDGFNPNDLGRLRRNDYTNFVGGISHQINPFKLFGPFQRASFRLFVGSGFSYKERLDLGLGTFLRTSWQTTRFEEIDFNVNTDFLFGGYDLNETRGLDPWAKPREVRFETSYKTDSRRSWQLEPKLELQFFEKSGHLFETSLEAVWDVSSRLNLEAEVGLNGDVNVLTWASNETFRHNNQGWQIGEESDEPEYITQFRTINDGGLLDQVTASRAPFDEQGHHYLSVFGRRDTRSLDFSFRSNITLSPALSVQLYSQLFVARGKYDDFSLMQDRNTLVPMDSYPKRHDFAFQYFLTNTVLRWEFKPGSTLFVVWSHSRENDDDFDIFDLTSPSPYEQNAAHQLTDTFGIFPTNVFLIKLTYKFLG